MMAIADSPLSMIGNAAPSVGGESIDIVVEHPEVVANRLIAYANLVGRENVIAGTDCGLGERVHPQIARAKLKALSEGARLATRQLWPERAHA
jgi:hypothetical protein